MRILGERALLFTDIEGSTALLQRIGASYSDVLDQHHRLMRGAFARGGGEEFQSEGDAFAVLFENAAAAVATAVDAQRRLQREPWPSDAHVRVRMGIHIGEIGRSESGFVGMPLHKAARVASAAHGGQILVSDEARQAIERTPLDDPAISLRTLGGFALKDIGPSVTLIQIMHPELPDQFPPPRTSGRHLNNLPGQLTTFVGRDDEAERVAELMRSHRLVTLCGAGGIGKTRLSLNVAAETMSRFADGVWLIELATLQSRPDIVDEVYRSMKIADDEPSERRLVEVLADKEALLVFDNCEHIVDDVAAVIELLTSKCPRVHVLATSREPLAVAGEMAWRVPSLSVADSVTLFIARAELNSAEFAPTPRDREVIERVCVRLDGIPLAIELVAARANTIPVDQIEEHLLGRLRLLTTGRRGGVARQQTLKATLEWSHRLLSSDERVVLRRLAVFRGQPEMDAIAAICGGDDIDDVSDVVRRLHAKSLLSIDVSHRPARVALTEIVRQFADEVLRDVGEHALVAERHASHFLAWSHHARLGCLGPDRLDWLRRFAADADNYAVAYDWLEEQNPTEAAVLIGNTKEWLISSDSRVWLERLQRISRRTDIEPRAIAIANSLRALYAGLYGREPAAVAATSARLAMANLDAVTDPGERLRVMTNAALGFREADPASGALLADQAVEQAQQLDDDNETAWSLVDLVLLRHEHNPDTRRFRAMQLELVDRLGDQWSNANPLVDQALDSYQVGRYDDALARLDDADRMLAPLPQRHEVASDDAHVLAVWGILIRAELGDTQLAILIAEDALRRLGDGSSHQAKELEATHGQALLIAGRADEARRAFEVATDRPDGWRYLTFALAMIGLATLDVAAGDAARASASIERIAQENRRLWVRARAHDVMAEAALVMGSREAAVEHIVAADTIRAEHGFVVPPAWRDRAIALRRDVGVSTV